MGKPVSRGGLQPTLLVTAILVFAAVPHLYRLYLGQGPLFGPDEGLPVVAARNLSEGLGYTVPVIGEDLATPRNRPLHRWPPGYSVTLWGLHSLGLDWVQAVFGFKTAVLLLAIAGWFWMAWRIFDSPVIAALLMVLVPFRFISNPADMFCCALAPLLFRGLETLSGKRPSKSGLLIVIGLASIACLIVVFKYSALYLVGAGLFWLTGLWWLRGRRWPDLARVVIYSVPRSRSSSTW